MSGDKTFSSGVGAASTGIEVASSGTANTIGSIVELDASTESEANGIVVTVASVGVVAATNISFLLNILTGPASSEVSLIDGIHFGQDLSVSNFTRGFSQSISHQGQGSAQPVRLTQPQPTLYLSYANLILNPIPLSLGIKLLLALVTTHLHLTALLQ